MFHELFRVLDIETVPDLRFWTPGESKWSLRPRRAEQLAWVSFPGSVEGPWDNLEFVREVPFAPPQAQRVVAVAWCDVKMRMEADKPKVYELVGLHTRADWSKDFFDPAPERRLVSSFREAMAKEPATIVTWNGRQFDLPVLAARALHLGVPWGWYYEERDVRYRYSTDGHCDLMDVMSDYGAARSMKLDDAARLIGLPGKGSATSVDHVDGSKVADIVAEGVVPVNQERIARYCLQDVVQTAIFFLRTRYHLEILTAAEYALSLATFSESEEVRKIIDVDWDRCAVE